MASYYVHSGSSPQDHLLWNNSPPCGCRGFSRFVAWFFAAPVMLTTLGLSALPELSPERALTEVMTNDLSLTVANFRARYSEHTVRYTGTVVRKNPKEELLVFRGGRIHGDRLRRAGEPRRGRLARVPRYWGGGRITIVAVVDRLVPPFGVGSSSVRLSDARVYGGGR